MIYDYVFVIFTNLYRLKHNNRNPLPAVAFGHNIQDTGKGEITSGE
jgi:hypothetical protein